MRPPRTPRRHADSSAIPADVAPVSDMQPVYPVVTRRVLRRPSRHLVKTGDIGTPSKPEGQRAPFGGRWLVLSDSGHCLLDYPADACDLERDVPLGPLCSLVTAVLQFSTAACGERGPPVHTMTFGNVSVIARCGDGFSVAVARVEDQPESCSGSISPREVTLQYKALEVYAALEATVGTALRDLASTAADVSNAQVADYTLTSMLGGDPSAENPLAIEGRLDREMAMLARDSVTRVLQRSYTGMLWQVLASLTVEARRQVKALGIFDMRHGPLAWLSRAQDAVATTIASAEAAVAAAAATPPPLAEGCCGLQVPEFTGGGCCKDADLALMLAAARTLGHRRAAAAAVQQQHLQQHERGGDGATLWRWAQAPQMRSTERFSDDLLFLACATGPLHVGLHFRVGLRPSPSSGQVADCSSRPSATDVEQVLPEEAEQLWPAPTQPSGSAACLPPEEEPTLLAVFGPMRAVAHVAQQLAQALGGSIVESARPPAESSASEHTNA